MYELSKTLGIEKREKFNNLINGNHLIKLGLKPSQEFKQILEQALEAQLEGLFKTEEEGIEYIKRSLL